MLGLVLGLLWWRVCCLLVLLRLSVLLFVQLLLVLLLLLLLLKVKCKGEFIYVVIFILYSVHEQPKVFKGDLRCIDSQMY